MNHIFLYAKQYKKQCLLAPLFKMFEALMELSVPLVLKRMIDDGIPTGRVSEIFSRAPLLLALGFFGLGFTAVAQYFSADAAAGITARLRHALLEKIETLPQADLDNIGGAALITRLTGDTAQVGTGINLFLRLMLRSPFIVFGAAVMAFTVDPKTALVFLGVIPLLSAAVFAVSAVCVPLYKKVGKRLDEVTLAARENLSGVRVIRAARREKAELARFEDRVGSLAGEQKKVGRISSILNPLTYVIINSAIAVLIYVGAIRVHSGELTQGAVVALYNYMSQILVELIKFANLIVTVSKAAASQKRIEAVLAIKPSMSAPAIAPKEHGRGEISLRSAELCYRDASRPAVSGIDLEIKGGEFIGIIGGTGSGKSSLLSLIPRLYDCTEGAVSVDGADVRDYPFETLRNKIALVPQHSSFFTGTVRENLKFAREDATDDELYFALSAACAADFLKEKGGLDAPVSKGGENFSGGQRQRLAVARAIVRKPEILLLDDSFSALDFATEAAVCRAVSALPFNPTVLLVSQRAPTVSRADKILVLDNGRNMGFGTHKELLSCCPVYREIYETQVEGGEGDE